MKGFVIGKPLLSFLLLLSVAANVFVLGIVLSPRVFGPPVPPPPPLSIPPHMVIEQLADGLSAQGKEALMNRLRINGAELDKFFRDFNASQTAVFDQFASAHYDEAAYQSALVARKAAADNFFNAMSRFFLEAGHDLSPEDRRRIVDRVRL